MSQEHTQPSQGSMSYALALNEAKQMIVQQQLRIKSDAEKLRVQQQTIVDQSSALTEAEGRIREQSTAIERLDGELTTTIATLADITTAKEQAEAVIDRQGERITHLQSTVAEFERRTAEQAGQIGELTGERDALRAQLPTPEDEAALASMMDLLARRTRRAGAPTTGLRLADDREPGSSEQPQTEAAPHAEAA